MEKECSAKIIGIARHRIATDGEGVTTLVGFWGCPLRCQYCLNPQSLKEGEHFQTYTPAELYEKVKIDQIYFLATNGGITFGGGEPLLHPNFLHEFRELCGPQWNITLETCLNVPLEHLQRANEAVDNYIVDIKEMDPEIYKQYTGKENHRVFENLKWLVENTDPASILVRIPLIPDFNTEEENQKSEAFIRQMGIEKIDRFLYKKEIHKTVNP